MRKTSIETFRKIESEGLLSKLRFRVYEILFERGPLTQGQVREISGIAHQSITPRFAELEKLGVIETTREVRCPVSGRQALLWDVTDRLPQKPKQKTVLQKLEDQIRRCKKRLANLFQRRDSILREKYECDQLKLFGLGSSEEERPPGAQQ